MIMKKILFLILFIMLVNVVIAQTPSCGADFGYDKKECYSNVDFLTASNALKWNLEFVNLNDPSTFLNKGVYKRDDIYSKQSAYQSPYFYQSLPDDKYSKLNHKLVNFDLISDHNKIDEAKYLKDLGCTACSLSRGGQNVKFSERGITHPNGDFVSVPGIYPSGTLFLATKDRIEVIVPKGTTSIDISKSDSVTIDTQGNELTLSNGAKINGKISYDNGQTYIKKTDKVIINDVGLFNINNNIEVFFDESEHTGDYVSFGNKKITLQGHNFEAEFKEGNLYVDVKLAENDRFIVNPLNNGKVSIINHANENKVSEVIITGPENQQEWARIQNGKFDATLGNEGVMKLNANQALQSDFGSVPIEIKIFDEEGKSLILGENGEEGKIVINNDNDLSYNSINSDVNINGVASCSSGVIHTGNVITGHDVLSRADAKLACWLGMTKYYNNKRTYLKNYLQKNFGRGTQYNIEFVDIDKWSYSDLDHVSENLYELYELSPNLVKAIGKIKLVDNEHMQRLYGKDFSTAAYADSVNDLVALNKDNILYVFPSEGLLASTLAHEAAHKWHISRLSPLELAEFQDAWYKATDEGDRLKGEKMYYAVHWSERSDWKLLTDSIKGYFSLGDGGWINDYGRSNIREDVATTVEEIAASGGVPEFEKNQHYRQKVYLLCQYDFLPKNKGVCTSWRW